MTQAAKPTGLPVVELPNPAPETYVDGALSVGIDGAHVMITLTTGRTITDQPAHTMNRVITARLVMPLRLLGELSSKAQALIKMSEQRRARIGAGSIEP